MFLSTARRRGLHRCIPDTIITARRLCKEYCSSSVRITHYSLLGVASTASTAQIKSAFHKVCAALSSSELLDTACRICTGSLSIACYIQLADIAPAAGTERVIQ